MLRMAHDGEVGKDFADDRRKLEAMAEHGAATMISVHLGSRSRMKSPSGVMV